MDAFADVDRDQLVWGVVGVLLTVVVAFVIYAFVGAIVFGLFLYYALRPVHEWLEERMEHPDVSVTITLLVVGLPALVIVGYAALVGYQEFIQLLGQPPLQGGFRSLLQPYVDVGALTQPRRVLQVTRNNLNSILGYAGTIFLWGVRVFVMITVAFYLLRDDDAIARWYRDSFDDVDGAVEFMRGVDDDLDTIYTGNLITIGITTLLAAVVYYAFEWFTQVTAISSPLLLGALIGVSTLVPVLGMKIVYLPFTGYLLVRAAVWNQIPIWIPVAYLAVTFVVIDTLPDIFIRSYVSKGGINMGLMILSYVLGSIAFGWYGVFLGPIVLVLALHFAEDVLPRLVRGRSMRLAAETDTD